MSTGENEQGLRVVIDLTRKISIFILILHFYVFCYSAFQNWGLTNEIVEHIIIKFGSSGLYDGLYRTKLISLLLLLLSLLGAQGRKEEKSKLTNVLVVIGLGAFSYFCSVVFFYLSLSVALAAAGYIIFCSLGFILILSGGVRLSRIVKVQLGKDVFNDENETFPQEERLLQNEFSVNIPSEYIYKGKKGRSWINIINGARMVLIAGSPGAGKTYFLVRTIIKQLIEKKQYSMLLYDFKYDDLAKIAYNSFLKSKHLYPAAAEFNVIDFDKPINRSNPLAPSTMRDITDASESARTILLALNMEWIKKNGDFWVESAITFVTAIIWYLRKYANGKYCTLPHAITLANVDYEDLFTVVSAEPECENMLSSFITAFTNGAREQLEGQIGSAKIALARLTSPILYYVLSGDDFDLAINDPEKPRIVVLANNPEKTQIYGAVISLYLNRAFRILPKKGRNKCAIVADEFASLFANGIENFLAICRGYKISTYIAVQNLNQLRKSYGREQADVIWNLAGNIICGQVMGDTAKAVSESIGKIVQTRESVSINRTDTNVSRNTQLDYAVPSSKISTLSSGQFVGILADNPDQQMSLKIFNCAIRNDHEDIRKETESYVDIPTPNTSEAEIQNTFVRIQQDINQLIESEKDRIRRDPDLARLLFVHQDDKE